MSLLYCPTSFSDLGSSGEISLQLCKNSRGKDFVVMLKEDAP